MLHAAVMAAALAGPAVELRWDAPAGCPSQEEVAGQIAEMVGDSAEAPARVEFRVERRDERWQLVGEISGVADGGRRELSAASCEELAEAAVLIVAIAVDPPVVPEAPEPAPVGEAEPEPVAAPVVEPASTEQAQRQLRAERAFVWLSRSPTRRAWALVGLGGGAGIGVLPGPAGVVRLSLGVRGSRRPGVFTTERWSVALVQDVWLPRGLEVSSAPRYGGRFWAYSAGVRGCGVVWTGESVESGGGRRLSVPLCGAIAAGVMVGEGTGALSVSQRRVAPWVTASAGPGLRVRLSPQVGLLFAAEVVVALARPQFDITGEGVVCCGRVGGLFTGGIDLRLPGSDRASRRKNR